MKTRIIFLSGALAFCALMALGLSTAPTPIFAQPDKDAKKRPVGVETGDEALDSDKTEAYDQRTAPQGTEIGTNTLYGENAGKSITTGLSNTLVGSEAGHSNKEGWANTFLGRNAGYHTTSGGNTFIGYYAGYLNTGSEENTFVGSNAGKNTTGSGNSFFGLSAGVGNTTGHGNCFFGAVAGYSNSTGYANSFFGVNAGENNTTGIENTFIGDFAGYSNIAGNRNVFLGNEAGLYETGSDKLYVDNSDTTNPLIWGDFATNDVVIYGGFKAIASYISSDGRWKKNIEPLASSLDKISSLQGVSYEWKRDEYPDFGLAEGKQIGLVAQNVEKVLPELVAEDKDGYKSVSYTRLTAVLVEAVKELKAENKRQKGLLEKQQQQFEKQQAEIKALRSMIKELKS